MAQNNSDIGPQENDPTKNPFYLQPSKDAGLVGLEDQRTGEAEKGIKPTPTQKFISELSVQNATSNVGGFLGWGSVMGLGKPVFARKFEELMDQYYWNPDAKMLSPKEAKELYGLDVPDNIHPGVAKQRYEFKQWLSKEIEWAARQEDKGLLGNKVFQVGVGATVGGLGGGIGGAVVAGALTGVAGLPAAMVGASDPLNIAAARAVEGAAKTLNILQKKSYKNLFVTEAVGNLIMDIPNFITAKSMGDEVSLQDTIINSVGAAAFSAGVRGFLGKGGTPTPKAPDGTITPPTPPPFRGPRTTTPQEVKSLVVQHESGARLNTELDQIESTAQRAGLPTKDSVPFNFRALEHRGNVGTPIYLVGDWEGFPIAVDNPYVANNNAALEGAFKEIRLSKDSKFFSVDHIGQVEDNITLAVNKVLESARAERLWDPEKESFRSITSKLELIDDQSISVFNAFEGAAKKSGYTGFVSASDNTNTFNLFRDAQYDVVRTMAHNSEHVPRVSPEQRRASLVQQLSDPTNQRNYNPELVTEVDRLSRQRTTAEETIDSAVEMARDAEAQLKALVETRVNRPEMFTRVEGLRPAAIGDNFAGASEKVVRNMGKWYSFTDNTGTKAFLRVEGVDRTSFLVGSYVEKNGELKRTGETQFAYDPGMRSHGILPGVAADTRVSYTSTSGARSLPSGDNYKQSAAGVEGAFTGRGHASARNDLVDKLGLVLRANESRTLYGEEFRAKYNARFAEGKRAIIEEATQASIQDKALQAELDQVEADFKQDKKLTDSLQKLSECIGGRNF